MKMEIDKRLARLVAASDDRFHEAPERIGWADVGDLDHDNAQLKQITDQISNRGGQFSNPIK
ncbi:MAG: hypothetical protein DWQ08_00285 [Proteobacteria bacterium]|nr:MAG: hypothetical protein DWQ08_00285 [Pseudomonadota bacterium]